MTRLHHLKDKKKKNNLSYQPAILIFLNGASALKFAISGSTLL